MVPGARQSGGRDKVIHLISQADRARKLAAGCRSPVIAELFILHAQLCEENARKTPPPRSGCRKPLQGATISNPHTFAFFRGRFQTTERFLADPV